jgi:hypothetical protein
VDSRDKVEKRRDEFACAILSGLIARGEVLTDPFGKLLSDDADFDNIAVKPEAKKRMMMATAISLGFANDIVQLVGPPPRPGRVDPDTGRSWHPLLDLSGLDRLEHVTSDGELVIRVYATQNFYRVYETPDKQKQCEAQIVEWLIQDCGHNCRLEWYRPDGDGPFGQP